MKIRWPRLTFPPINLWTAPHQPALEDTMTEAAERDSVQDQLCSRIDDLEMEKEALAAQLDRAEEERDKAFAKGKQAFDDLRRVEAERAALAAHVVRLMGALELARDRISMLAEIATDKGADVYAALDMWPEEMEQTLAETPATSLDHRDAEQLLALADALEQAEAPDAEGGNMWDASQCADWIREKAELRRQAEDA